MKINNKKDILLLLLYSPTKDEEFNAPIIGRTRFVKMLFLFKKEVLNEFNKKNLIDPEQFYKFYAWDFGPFSKEIYDDINFFLMRKFIKSSFSDKHESIAESAEEFNHWRNNIEVNEDENVVEYQDEEFILSKSGCDFAKKMYDELEDYQKIILAEFKQKLSNAPLRSLLRYVYTNYPEKTSKSKIKNQILK